MNRERNRESIVSRADDSTEALRAFGVAIATVAHARLLSRALEGQLLTTDRDDPVGIEAQFWSTGERRNEGVFRLGRLTFAHPGALEVISEWHGHLHDTAPLVVARMIEEADKMLDDLPQLAAEVLDRRCRTIDHLTVHGVGVGLDELIVYCHGPAKAIAFIPKTLVGIQVRVANDRIGPA